jgi:hypothetical protein
VPFGDDRPKIKLVRDLARGGLLRKGAAARELRFKMGGASVAIRFEFHPVRSRQMEPSRDQLAAKLREII